MARPTVTFPASGHHRLLAGTKLYCLGTQADVCEQLTQGCYLTVLQARVDPGTFWTPDWPVTWPHCLTGVRLNTRDTVVDWHAAAVSVFTCESSYAFSAS